MSGGIEKRHVADAYCVEVSNAGAGKVRFLVRGETTTGRMVEIKIDTPWHRWPCVANKFAQAWTNERASRVSELNRIDKALPQ